MRNKTEMKEYMQKHRFCKILERMKRQQVKCNFCEITLQTLHHKDENHANNRLDNLLPVCHPHHLEIVHQSDTPKIYPNFNDFSPKKTVTSQRTIESVLQNCNTGRIYNLTLRKSIGCNKTIRIEEGSCHLVEFLNSLGFNEVI